MAKRKFNVRLLVRVDDGELELSYDDVPWPLLRDAIDLLSGLSEGELRLPFWRRWGKKGGAHE